MKKGVNPESVTVISPNQYLFYWHCDDCRVGGIANITLPVQVRNLGHALEHFRDQAHLHHNCTSDYSEVRMIESDDAPSVPSAAPALNATGVSSENKSGLSGGGLQTWLEAGENSSPPASSCDWTVTDGEACSVIGGDGKPVEFMTNLPRPIALSYCKSINASQLEDKKEKLALAERAVEIQAERTRLFMENEQLKKEIERLTNQNTSDFKIQQILLRHHEGLEKALSAQLTKAREALRLAKIELLAGPEIEDKSIFVTIDAALSSLSEPQQTP